MPRITANGGDAQAVVTFTESGFVAIDCDGLDRIVPLTVIPDRAHLESAFEELERRYADSPVPVPDYWGGYRLIPETIEFWQGRVSRLHDRLRYRRGERGEWIVERLAP